MEGRDMIILSTYPRSGSHLLRNHIHNKMPDLRHKLISTHKHIYENDSYLISILRDPIDVMASKLIMDIHYERHCKTLELCFMEAKGHYLSFFNYINENASLLIKYEDLINNMDKVLEAISKNLEMPVVDGVVPQTVDNPNFFHLASSKTSPAYEECYKFILKQDMSDFYETYNKAMAKDCVLVV